MNKYPPSRIVGFKKRWPKQTLKQRFLTKVVRTNDCWIWVGAADGRKGYGSFRWNSNSTKRAHRAAWIIFRKKIPAGLHVLHKCDNPGCVNPRHLFLGTNQDNIDDARKKGRNVLKSRPGMLHGNAKLTDSQVKRIRKSNQSTYKLAEKYGIARQVIGKIKRRIAWKHI